MMSCTARAHHELPDATRRVGRAGRRLRSEALVGMFVAGQYHMALGLADHGMRLRVPLLVGLVVDPLVPTKEPQEPTTVTPAEIIDHRRVQVLDRAGKTSVTEACRTFGISRTTYYRWAGRAQRSGLAALLPEGRRLLVMPTATPPDQVEAVLAERSPGRPWAPGAWSTTWPDTATR
jgi:Helix-turn-helix domain